MRRYYVMLLLITINLIVIFYIDYRINILDENYYNGKDGGLTVRFVATVIFSIIYFFIVGRNKIVFLLYGFIIGIISFVICYLIIGKFTTLNDIFYQIAPTILFIVIFHLTVRDKVRGNVSD